MIRKNYTTSIRYCVDQRAGCQHEADARVAHKVVSLLPRRAAIKSVSETSSQAGLSAYKIRVPSPDVYSSNSSFLNTKSEPKLLISSMKTHLWLRCETKPFETRAALTPAAAKKLIEAGINVTVEQDPKRIFDIEEYRKYASPSPRTEPKESSVLTILLDSRLGLAAKSNHTIHGPAHLLQRSF